jgi:hypothetical protein
MPVVCKICNAEYPNLISSSHLKTHNIKTNEYKILYGNNSLASDEYRQTRSLSSKGEKNPNYGNKMPTESREIISKKNRGKIPWNKDIVLDDTSIYKAAALRREEKYNNKELIRHSSIPTNETKLKISNGVKLYSKNNPDKVSERSQKAIETKKSMGYDLGFFRGKTHTDDAKLLISNKSKIAAIAKKELSYKLKAERIEKAGLLLLNEFDNHYLKLQCQNCGNEFSHTHQMFQLSKFTEDRCNICYPPIIHRSTKEIEVYDYVKTLCPDAIANYKYSGKKELDIFIPSLNIGIEFNGLYWHSEKVLEANNKHKLSDFKKYTEVTSMGIRCIIILEDEWDNKQPIVKSRLRHILTKSLKKIPARKCTIKEIDTTTASVFCNKYHLQGHGRSNVRLGLYYNDELIAVMTFSKGNISRKINDWELNRFCTVENVIIQGGASKLFSSFIKLYSVSTVITYADKRWSYGNLYKSIGFTFDKDSAPSYWYIYPNESKRYHRFALRKNIHDNASLTEWENRQGQGWNRIWDCGNSKWVWNKTYI